MYTKPWSVEMSVIEPIANLQRPPRAVEYPFAKSGVGHCPAGRDGEHELARSWALMLDTGTSVFIDSDHVAPE